MSRNELMSAQPFFIHMLPSFLLHHAQSSNAGGIFCHGGGRGSSPFVRPLFSVTYEGIVKLILNFFTTGLAMQLVRGLNLEKQHRLHAKEASKSRTQRFFVSRVTR